MSDLQKVSDILKRADLTSIFKKRNDNEKENYRSVTICCQVFQKCLKNYYLNKLMIICKVNSRSMLQFLAKTTAVKRLNWL